MKNIIPAILAYIVVCIVSLFLPASSGYDVISWKLLVGQVYAIPAFVIVLLIAFLANKIKKQRFS